MEVTLTQIKGDPVLFVHQDGGKIFRVESHDGGKSWEEAAPVGVLKASPFASLAEMPGHRRLISAASDGHQVALALKGIDSRTPGMMLWSEDGGHDFNLLFELLPGDPAWPIYFKEAGWWAIASHQKWAAIAPIMPPAPANVLLTRHGQEWPGWQIVDVCPDEAGVYLLVDVDSHYGALELPWGSFDCHDWMWFSPRIWPRPVGAVCVVDQVPVFLLPYAEGRMEVFVGDAPTQGLVVPAPGEPVSLEWSPKHRHFVAVFRRLSGQYVAAWAPAGSFNFEISWEEEE